ncbi:MAG: hypothetical protein ACK522_10370, partial [Synechococcaceae cyanobacterium]
MGRPAPLGFLRQRSRAALLPLAALAGVPAMVPAPAAAQSSAAVEPAPSRTPGAKASKTPAPAAESGRGSSGEEAPFVIWQPEGPPPPSRPSPLAPEG